VYYIKVWPSSGSGTYQIGFNLSIAPPGTTTLTIDTWADGEIATSDGEQWFKFTATASTQYIHVTFGTLTSLTMQLYNSTGNTVESQAYLSGSTSSTKYTTYYTVTNGYVYYIKVWPSYSSYSGTYQIGFNTGSIPPGFSATELTAAAWEDGNIPTSDDEQWFQFIATASTQYIHVSFGTLTNLYMQVYNSTGTEVGSQAYLYDSTKYTGRTVTSGDMYYIKVRPSSSSHSGDYQITFNTSFIPPGISPAALAVNTWTNGDIPVNGEQWFTFTATASTQYIHAAFGMLQHLYVQVYNSTGFPVGDQGYLYSGILYISRTVTTGEVYYIKVRPPSDESGDYQIGFNPGIAPPGATTLTADTWAAGNIPISGGEQWFQFTATASTRYIHVAFGTLAGLKVQLYDSAGITTGGMTNLYGTTTSITTSATNGDMYYIKVIPSISNSNGDYQITVSADSATPPGGGS
jgi:hypothetical protein